MYITQYFKHFLLVLKKTLLTLMTRHVTIRKNTLWLPLSLSQQSTISIRTKHQSLAIQSLQSITPNVPYY